MKIVAITGGGQGIGRAVAFHFAKAGYAVSIADVDAAAGREAAKILRETGVPAFFLRTDISKEKDVAGPFEVQAGVIRRTPDFPIQECLNSGIQVQESLWLLVRPLNPDP